MRNTSLKRALFRFLASLVIGATFSVGALAAPSVVIILDDLGYRQTDSEALMLPTEVVFAILPDTPLATSLSQQADSQGRDVMLHLPMQAVANNRLLGPRAIMADMYPSGIARTLEAALKSVPNARGVNNHMGSLLTRQRNAMQALMYEVGQREMFFIDSRTTPNSLAQKVAEEHGVPSAHRHVFIDHVKTPAFMQQQLDQLTRIARHHGVGIGIAHPHPETLSFLHDKLPALKASGVQLISLSTYFARQKSTPASELTAGSRVAAPK